MGISSEFSSNTETMYVGEAGTFRYMSPEQLGGVLSFKSDIWSYGCVMFELLTGQHPYGDMTQMEACVIVNKSE